MSEAGDKSYHFNSNTRLNFGSKASMANNEDPYLRALEFKNGREKFANGNWKDKESYKN